MIRALTVKNPWAALIAAGIKDVENRSWAPPRSFTSSDLLLIHAGAARDHDAYSEALVIANLPRGEQPSGAVVAAARVRDVHTCDGRCSPWAVPGDVHWMLAGVRRLAEPVPARGKLGLWTPGDDLMMAVTRSLRTAGCV